MRGLDKTREDKFHAFGSLHLSVILNVDSPTSNIKYAHGCIRSFMGHV